MARRKSIGLRKQLTSVISRRRIDQLAEVAGLVQRHRKVAAVDLFWTLVLGFGGAGVRMLAGLRRAYVASTGIALTASAFYKRFTPRLTTFLRAVVAEISAAARVADGRLQGILRSFKDVLIVDSTLVKLHDLLEKKFPGTRKNSAKASAKLSVVMSVKSQGPHSVKLTSGRRHDRRVLQVGRWVADRLMLFDLGYFHDQLFDCIGRNGGWFVTRLKENANPLITKLLRLCRGASVPIVGERLRAVADRLQRQVLDVEVEVDVRRRTYRGRQTRVARRLRLVGILDEGTEDYHFYLTNIPADRLSAEEIARLYRARWLVELLFKEMKSCYRLEDMPSRKANIVEALLYVTVITVLVSRRLLATVREIAGDTTGRRIPDARWAAIFASRASALLSIVLLPPAAVRGLARYVERMLLAEAVDPNAARVPLLLRVAKGAAC